mmetsp:Transcript_40406/g.90687  ORF Transcript_40406/g.90687 Transcript_40406/m.90687 type:complete len:267 (-) Transcript_40406:587-1387(-)
MRLPVGLMGCWSCAPSFASLPPTWTAWDASGMASPKSMIFTCPNPSSMMFSTLMSLWMKPFVWRCSRPRTTWLKSPLASGSSNPPPVSLTRCTRAKKRSPPSIRSTTKNNLADVWKASWQRWRKREGGSFRSTLSSFFRRRLSRDRTILDLSITFIANASWVLGSSTSTTTENPPAPRPPRTVYEGSGSPGSLGENSGWVRSPLVDRLALRARPDSNAPSAPRGVTGPDARAPPPAPSAAPSGSGGEGGAGLLDWVPAGLDSSPER